MSEAPAPVAGPSNVNASSYYLTTPLKANLLFLLSLSDPIPIIPNEIPIISYEEALACLPQTLNQSNNEACYEFSQDPNTTDEQKVAILCLWTDRVSKDLEKGNESLRQASYDIRRMGQVQVNMEMTRYGYPLPIYEDIDGKTHPDGIPKKYHHLETFDQICDLPVPFLDRWYKFINGELYEIEKEKDSFYRAKSLYASLGGGRNASVDARERIYEMKSRHRRRKGMTQKKRKTK
ncbi:hypothetical protein V865_002287 [Kwoniella europaea PYCC6329]|uniref:Uncharacterized protein n=1 Tax=Kwoniella europaea PYCC6329 TaxID=1423913 RepID=A0AAX4KDX5_9TREE